MPSEHRERVAIIQERGYAPKALVRDIVLNQLSQFLWLVASLVVILLLCRFTLHLAGANPGNGFVAIIYGLTAPLTYLFQDIVRSPQLANGGVVDIPVMFAIPTHVFVIWIVVTFLRIILSDTYSMRNLIIQN